MQFTFLDMKGETLFIRDDAERAQWTQEELSLDLEFPYVAGKVVSIGQRIFFRSPTDGSHQIYEVKQAQTTEPEHFQTITAEHICISELTDEHMDNRELLNVSATSALASVLTGTLWSVGTVAVNPVSMGEMSRGSVWQSVLEIKQDWNVYIEPRVTLSADGSISRKLDILSVDGVWNGIRLSVDKNMIDPVVTIDDSEVATAIYGYGGTTTPTSAEEEQVEITIKDTVWAKTADHPAKPAGQNYLEDPEATRLYGRNGRPRFGYYQNSDILDPYLLLEKVWENLKAARTPAIGVDGTVEDLYRLGYADQPLKLHDIALVEVLPAGFKKEIQIIRMTVDLLDPSATTLTIGAYVPNIVYIQKEEAYEVTNEQGGRSGGGGGGGAKKKTERSEYETKISQNNRMIQLRAYQNDLNDLDNEVKLQEAKITIEANRITQEVADRRDADNMLNSSITQTARQIQLEVTERNKQYQQLSGRITVNSNKVSMVVTERGGNYVVNTASIVAGINADHGSYVQIQADTINLSGYVTASQLSATDAKINNLMSGSTVATYLNCGTFRCGAAQFQLGADYVRKDTITIDGHTYKVLMY